MYKRRLVAWLVPQGQRGWGVGAGVTVPRLLSVCLPSPSPSPAEQAAAPSLKSPALSVPHG